jgi:hypothetical protein
MEQERYLPAEGTEGHADLSLSTGAEQTYPQAASTQIIELERKILSRKNDR